VWATRKLVPMNKAFTRESEQEDDDDTPESAPPLPAGTRNYMTPGGFARLKSELDHLHGTERPQLVSTIAWAAGNGDRSENGDYIYGKKRLREVDRRIRFLVRRLDIAEVVDPAARAAAEEDDRVFFGATVTVVDSQGQRRRLSIVGVDEIDTARGYISWVSPIARALIKAHEGDTVTVQTPGGTEQLEIEAVSYVALATGAAAVEPPVAPAAQRG
jgi:transcription elongation factor GreB